MSGILSRFASAKNIGNQISLISLAEIIVGAKMTLIDILISASCGAAVVGAAWAGSRFYRDWRNDIAAGEAYAELEKQAMEDIEVHGRLKAEADRLAYLARKARNNHARSKRLSDQAVEARNAQMRCEMRLRAAGYGHLVLGEAA